MKLIIDIPEKTVAHIRSDYGHGIKNIGFEEDRKLITEEIINSITLCKELEEIAKEFTEQKIQVMVWGNGVVPLVDLRDCVKILDKRIAELKGE